MEGYMSTAEAAEALGVNRSRVCQLVKAGKLEAERIGNAYAVSADSVARRLEESPTAGNPNFGKPGYGKGKRRAVAPDGYMTVKEAAAALGVSGARVRQLIGEGRLTARKRKGANIVPAAEVAELAAGR